MRATIGITAGDPAGIGLEVVLKSISSVLISARWLLFTDREIFERNVARFDPEAVHRLVPIYLRPSEAERRHLPAAASSLREGR